MKLKMIAILLAACMLLAFGAGAAGILKTESSGAENEAGHLIGVLITAEVLRNPNADTNDNTVFYGSLEEAMAASISNDRVWAVLKDSEEGAGIKNTSGKEFVFEGIEGIPFYSTEMSSENGAPFYASVAGEGLSDVEFHYGNLPDGTGDSLRLVASLYFTEGSPDVVYLNPVYQTADGRVYAEQGSGVACQIGMSMTQSMKNSRSKTGPDGETVAEETEITLKLEAVDAPKEYTVLQFGADDTLHSKETFAPDAVPETLAVPAEAEYLVIKTVSTDALGKETVACETAVRGDETLTVFAPTENGYLAKNDIALQWK